MFGYVQRFDLNRGDTTMPRFELGVIIMMMLFLAYKLGEILGFLF